MQNNSYYFNQEINYSIESVKSAMKYILSKYATRFLHSEEDINETFNTYRFGEIKCSYLVSLEKVDENHTKVSLTCSPREGGFQPSPASIESYASEFLNILSARLEGKTGTELHNIVKKNNSDSTLSGLSAIISFILLALALAWIFFL